MSFRIIDVSSVLHSGYGTSFGKDAYYKGIPTGGLYLLAQVLGSSIKKNDLVALVWDSPTNRRDYLPEYKSTRCADPKVRFASKLAYEYLKNSTKNCFKVEGYEADDLAASLIEYQKEKNFYTELYTADYDWAHNIYSERQELYPANKNICRVTKENFNVIFSTINCKMVFNALTVKKIFFGDNSDHVPPYNPLPYSNEQLYKAFINYCSSNNSDPRLKETFIGFVNKFRTVLKPGVADELLNRAEVLFPRITPEPLLVEFSEINIDAFSKFCSIIGCKNLCKKLGIRFIEDMGQEQARVKFIYEEESSISKTRYFTVPDSKDFLMNNRRAFI